MLYRPMIPDNRDILFSGAVTTAGNPDEDLKLIAEVEHLTCFIGGMIGMGAKIFGIEGDLELAKKLADGCVWAYESTPMGIMPEGATVLPCQSVEHCTWNETAYFHFLDPMAEERDSILEKYIANKDFREAEAKAQAKALEESAATLPGSNATAQAKVALDDKKTSVEAEEVHTADNGFEPEQDIVGSSKAVPHGPASSPVSLQKRQDSPNPDLPRPVTHSSKDDDKKTDVKVQKDLGALKGISDGSKTATQKAYADRLQSTEAELENFALGRQSKAPSSEISPTATVDEDLPDPLRPFSHKEFVEARIKQEALPPGFVGIRGRKYILR